MQILAAIGLSDRADQRASAFSGGMKRRLNLGASLVHEPKILLLDEPTTGVDPQSRNHIFEEVRRLNQTGMTIVYTSHYMEEVQALCPRIAVLDGGKIRACDTLPNLLKRLDATIRVTVTSAPAGFADRLGAIPGVKRIRVLEGGFDLIVDDIGPVLAKVASACAAAGADLVSATTSEPTLERVFQAWPGRAAVCIPPLA